VIKLPLQQIDQSLIRVRILNQVITEKLIDAGL
jgi:hypothetical protein